MVKIFNIVQESPKFQILPQSFLYFEPSADLRKENEYFLKIIINAIVPS